MSESKNKEPAFPQPAISDNGRIDYAYERGVGGITIRDYFAASAINSAASNYIRSDDMEMVAQKAYKLADAMLAERNK